MAASPFRDPNLHLAVLDAAWEAGLLPVYEKARPSPDPEAIDREVRDALLATPIPQPVLESLVEIAWGGGKEIQHLIVEAWDGEDDTFNVEDLQGIGACRNLAKVAFGAANIDDLGPLAGLAALRVLRIGSNYRDDARNRDVLAALKKRGVELETREDAAARMLAHADEGTRKRAIEEGLVAFQEKRYRDAVAALDGYASSLDGSQRLKLEFARKQAAKA